MDRDPGRALTLHPDRRIARVIGIAVDTERDHSEALRAQVVEIRLMLGAGHTVVCLEHFALPPLFSAWVKLRSVPEARIHPLRRPVSRELITKFVERSAQAA